ncbi:O-antigen ligase family protein [Novosphingobium panipatense]|uniref:O-antigen ligase family protein n=1 Tax=Novosphingobium TaxID=165696 RepID=UPI001304D7CE|nr:O-antigen ligase family protein [Novosphingobium sp. HII-3]
MNSAATGTTSPGSSRLGALFQRRDVQDGGFVALILMARIPANAGTAGATIGVALMCLYLGLRLDQCRDVFQRCRPQLAYPLFALLSTIWAIHPEVTSRAAVQMILTAFTGLVFSQADRPRAVLVALFIVYSGYTVLSLMVGNTQLDGIEGIPALVGIGGEAKNYFSNSAATGVLLALIMAVACLEKRARGLALVSLSIASACLVATVRAHSAGAVASLALAVALLLPLLALRRRTPGLKAGLTIAMLIVLILGAAFFQPLLTLVQELSAKDAGLTGRGYLWYRAAFIIEESPWLGTGYFGFWIPENPDAVGFWRYFHIRQEGTAFSFHNSYIQTIVETGYLGLAVLVMSWGVGIIGLLRRFVLTPSLPTCFWLSYLALQLSKSPVELVRPAALVPTTIMLFTGLGFAGFPVVGQRLSRG